MIDQAPTSRLFVLLTSRPEFTLPWGQHGHVSQLTLSRLGRRQAPQMIARVAGNKPLPEEVVQQIVAKTDGVPLFVEELTKMVLESGLLTERDDHYELTGPLPPLAIPSTLQDSLMARLDRLATTKELAQLGATLGREFSYDMLQAVSPVGELTLQQERQPATGRVTDTRSLMPDTQGEAKACFLKALTIARKQEAKSLELRAAMSLARLWQSQGKTTEARDLLAPVYEWFTEGFDTKDLQEAKELLEGLT